MLPRVRIVAPWVEKTGIARTRAACPAAAQEIPEICFQRTLPYSLLAIVTSY